MIKIINKCAYKLLDEDTYNALHKSPFDETYEAIKSFSDQSKQIYTYINENKGSKTFKYLHEVLCALPGHGKTTALKYHIKIEIAQTLTKKSPYLLVFNNNDTMNDFYDEVNKFANKYDKKNAILAINEENISHFKTILDQYQIVCITQQRLRDLALGFGDKRAFFTYQQEQLYWGKRPPKTSKSRIQRTIIIDEMPDFFNSAIFDIGKENNAVDWYDVFANNTSEKELSATDKNNGRLYISKLISNEMYNIGRTTKKLIRTIEGTPEEKDFLRILEALNKENTDNESLVRYKWFEKLLHKDDIGSINRTTKKTNILCSEFIDYKPFGNIMVLDGTANLTHSNYHYAGFTVRKIHNFHQYSKRLFFEWSKINTSSSKRINDKSEVKDQISESLIGKRKKGIEILPIPSKGDVNFYINSGAITPEQHKKYFMVRQSKNDSMAINLHNVTGKNDLSQYKHIALLNLPIMQPDEYRLQAIAMYGTSSDLRLVKDLEPKEQGLHKNKWFADSLLQRVFEEQQKAELSQIIHRSSIRNINSNEKVIIHLYHNKEQVIDLLKETFQLTDENFTKIDMQRDNNFKIKCRNWAVLISDHLKNNPNTEYTAFKAGGGRNFQKWLNDNWNNKKTTIVKVFNEYGITINVKGKGGYKYLIYKDDGVFEELFG